MLGKFYSMDDVAELLDLHVKTVRGYVRDGKLRATRIGKQYRVAAADLEAFTGQPVQAKAGVRAGAGRVRRVEVTAIVQIDAADALTVRQIGSLVSAAVASRVQEPEKLRVETVYDEERAVLKLVLLGGFERVAEMLQAVGAVAQEGVGQ